IEFVQNTVDSLYSSDEAVMVQLHQVQQRGLELGNVDPELAARLKPLADAKAVLEDAVFELREYGKGLEANPEELSRCEERLSSLRKLQKKFGESVEQILGAHREIVEEINSLEKVDENLRELSEENLRLQKTLGKLAKDLQERRRN